MIQIITHRMVETAMVDPKFKARFPEFSSQSPVAPQGKQCPRCPSRQQARQQDSFRLIVSRMPEARLVELRDYFGIMGDMQVSTVTPSGAFVTSIVSGQGFVQPQNLNRPTTAAMLGGRRYIRK